MPDSQENNSGRFRADVNRARVLQAVRELQRLLNEALKPDFTGTVAVEVASKQGRLNTPRVTRTHFPEE